MSCNKSPFWIYYINVLICDKHNLRLNTLNSNRFQVEFVIEFLDWQETFVVAVCEMKTLAAFATDQMIILV